MNNFTKHIVTPLRKFRRGFLSNVVKIAPPIFLLITALLVTQTTANDAREAELEESRIEKKSTDITDNGRPEYTIEVGDVLYISVWQEDDLREDVIVRPDGKISFPLAGDVPAYCLTFDQLKEELSNRLKDYIRDPIVSISLRKMGGEKIIVLGEVTEPGVYSVTGQRTVLEAIALANGFTAHAVTSSVILIKGGLQSPEGMRLDLSQAIKKTDMSQNVTLQSEDIVYVPKKFIADVNYFVDQILGPIAKTVWTLHGIETLD